jgi:hypothetical protein
MQQFFAQIVFGWPFIILSLVLAFAGILLKRPVLLVASGILFIPPAWYLSGYPAIRWFGMLLPVSLFGAAYFVKQDKIRLALLLVLPPLVTSVWLAFIVIAQNRNLSGG